MHISRTLTSRNNASRLTNTVIKIQCSRFTEISVAKGQNIKLPAYRRLLFSLLNAEKQRK